MSNHLDLISPDENPNWIRVRQATKQGYIRLHRGGVRRPLIPTLETA